MTHPMTELSRPLSYDSHLMTHMTFQYLISVQNRLIHSVIGWQYFYKNGVFHSRSVSIPSGNEKFLQRCFPPVNPLFASK